MRSRRGPVNSTVGRFLTLSTVSFRSFRQIAKWPSIVWAAIALALVVYVRTRFVFDSGNVAGMLVLIAMIASVFTLIFGIAALPRWQGVVALLIFIYVAYCIGFTRMYGIA